MTTAPDSDASSPDTPRDPDEAAELRARPHVLDGSTYRALTPVGTAFITVNQDADGKMREVFVTVGRAGSDIAADAEALGRLISLVLRIPTPLSTVQVIEAVIDQLAGIGGSSSLGFGLQRVRSLADAIALVLLEHCRVAQMIDSGTTPAHPSNGERGKSFEEDDGLQADTLPVSDRALGQYTGDFCPSCGQMNLVNEEGCRKCYGCGYASC